MAYMDITTPPDAPPTQYPIDRLTSIKLVYKLAPAQALALDLLMERQVIQASDLVEAGIAPTKVTARTVLKRLRASLGDDKYQIENQYATGYWIDKETKTKIMDELIAFNYPGR